MRRDRRENDFFHFLSLLNEKDAVLDIGANIGFMTYHLARKVKSGKVYAFEPVPENIRTILRIKKFFRLKNIFLQDYALGNEKQMLTMVMPVIGKAKKQGLSHVTQNVSGEEGIIFHVEQNRLDDLRILKEEKIQGIKIDVENYEFQVFEGAKDLLQKNMPIVYCELWKNENRDRCFHMMKALGYEVMILSNRKLVHFEDDKHHTQNFFFMPNTL